MPSPGNSVALIHPPLDENPLRSPPRSNVCDTGELVREEFDELEGELGCDTRDGGKFTVSKLSLPG